MKPIKLCLSAFAMCIMLAAGGAWATTYYKQSRGTAANKEAATGPCTDLSACMNKTVYSGETFADGDVIVHCHTMIEDDDDVIFVDRSQTLSIPAAATNWTWNSTANITWNSTAAMTLN